MLHFTIYSRSYCHLCDDMLSALSQLKEHHAFTVDVIDVDADEASLALYDELVPVLTGRTDNQGERELCHYFFDRNAVLAFIAGQGKMRENE